MAILNLARLDGYIMIKSKNKRALVANLLLFFISGLVLGYLDTSPCARPGFHPAIEIYNPALYKALTWSFAIATIVAIGAMLSGFIALLRLKFLKADLETIAVRLNIAAIFIWIVFIISAIAISAGMPSYDCP